MPLRMHTRRVITARSRGPVGPLAGLLALLVLPACGVSLRAPVAPGGRVTTPEGRTISLPDLWADHPLVVVFYRGWW